MRLETTVGVQRRAIDAGGGCLCQTEPVAHFGLGSADPVRVDVRWPDGRERTLTDVRAERELSVPHPSQRSAATTEGQRRRGDNPLRR